MRLISVVLVVVVLLASLTSSGVQAQPALQDDVPPIVVQGRLAARATRPLINMYNENNETDFMVERRDGQSIVDLCEGSALIFATTRPATAEDLEQCAGVVELMVALDGAVVVTAETVDFISCLTREELEATFGADGAARWPEVNADFPDRTVSVYVPDRTPATVAFFDEEILSDVGSRSDTLNLSNTILRNLNARQSSIGYIPLQTYLDDPLSFTAPMLDNGESCVMPGERAVADGDYITGAPIYWYVPVESVVPRQTLVELVQFALSDEGQAVVSSAGAWPVPENLLALSFDNFVNNITGALISGSGSNENSFVVRLSWQSGHDLDLAVRLPSGAEVSFENQAREGFVRNADEGNEYCNRASAAPQESVQAVGTVEPGGYVAAVQQSFNCLQEDEQAAFTVKFVVNGMVVQSVDGVVGPGPDTFVTAYEYSGE